jgi:hypothetical protein
MQDGKFFFCNSKRKKKTTKFCMCNWSVVPIEYFRMANVKFSAVPKTYWGNIANQREYMNWLGQVLQIKKQEDWYLVTATDIQRYGGHHLFQYYKESVYDILKSTFPEHEWIPWKFHMVSKGFWKDNSNQRWFMDWLGKQIGIEHYEDWYRISKEDIIRHGGIGVLRQHGNTNQFMLS